MEYNYKNNTLLHSVGFNLQRFVSILNHGIVSKNKARELKLLYSKNYKIKGQNDDYISMLQFGLVNPNEDISAYKLHTIFGISFIIEDIDFIDDRDNHFIHRSDEVLVKDHISTNMIKGIAIPLNFQNTHLNNLLIIPPDVTSYNSIRDISISYYEFLKSFGYEIDFKEFSSYLNDLLFLQMNYSSLKELDADEFELNETKEEIRESLSELNKYLGEETSKCFEKLLGFNPTLTEVINYLTNGKYEIYNIPYEDEIIKRGV